jgi:hypothetical protein
LSDISGKIRKLAESDHENSELFHHVVDRLNELEVTKATLERWRTHLEWSGFRQGQGSGYMSSGGDGPLLPACPLCGHLKPSARAKGHFIAEVIGHKPDCEFRPRISSAETSLLRTSRILIT